MLDEYKTKEVGKKDKAAKGLKCVVNCWAPGLGEFKEGEIISGSDLVNKLKDNPNFVEEA